MSRNQGIVIIGAGNLSGEHRAKLVAILSEMEEAPMIPVVPIEEKILKIELLKTKAEFWEKPKSKYHN